MSHYWRGSSYRAPTESNGWESVLQQFTDRWRAILFMNSSVAHFLHTLDTFIDALDAFIDACLKTVERALLRDIFKRESVVNSFCTRVQRV